jgi:hypothetical protein
MEISDKFLNKKEILAVTKSLICQADDLALEHLQFNERYIVAGRLALYELLGKIYKLVLHFDKAVDKDDQLKLLKKSLFENYRIRTQENTSDVAILVRYITLADRKNVHIYARAIETARFHKVPVDNFVNFLQEHGGVERLRAIGVDSEAQDLAKDLEEEQIELAWKFLSARGEMPFASFEAPSAFRDIYNKNCAYEYVICVKDCDNKYHVVGQLPAETELENYLVKHLSKYLCNDMEIARQGVAKLEAEAEKRRAVRMAVDDIRREWKQELKQ